MLVTFLFAALIGKLIYIEVVSSSELQAKALSQWMRDVPLQAERGEIYDVNGTVLADSATTYTVYARPTSVVDKEYVASTLSGVLDLDKTETLKKLSSRISEITIAKSVSKPQMYTLYSSDLSGIYYSQNIRRVYPYGDFMTQVLGFTNSDIRGQTGVEAFYDSYLTGRDGYLLTETDLIGRELDTNVTRYVGGTKGNAVYLTVDYYIQAFAESAVSKAMLNHSAKSATCIVMDVNTGAICALAESPSFDLNNVPRDDLQTLFERAKTTAVSAVFEPGSTFKIITAAIGLETGAVSLDTTCFCGGFRMIDGQRIKCWRTIGHGSQSFTKGVQNSCNCLFMDTALAIGTTAFYDKIRKFGFTVKSGIDVVGETAGILISEESVKTVDLARIGFGQAIAVTPIGLVRAAAAAINGGKLVTPFIVDKIVGSNGDILLKNETTVTNNVVSEQTSATLRAVLESVVSEGSGRNAAVAGYKIGGKTGTAQKYENGAIARGKYISTFIGFAPADNPRYIALMLVDEPQGAYYGSVVAAPYIGELYSKLFAYKNIPPASEIEEAPQVLMPNLIGLSAEEAISELKKYNVYCEVDGEGGSVNKQVPAAGSYIREGGVAIISIA